MRLYPFIRFLSMLAYFLIFLYGDMIQAPMVFFMLGALFGSGFLSEILAILTFLGLLTLVILIMVEKSKRTLLIETLVFIFLLLPIVNVLTFATTQLLKYPMFIIPTICFVLLYPLSLYFSYKEYRNKILTKTN